MKMKKFFLVVAVVCCGVLSARGSLFAATIRTTTGITISSPAFAYGHVIPRKYTCSGANISPALSWKHVPKGAKSLVLIVEDPDAPAGVWTHWLIYNIPAHNHGLPAHMPARPQLADGSVQSMNSFGKTGYGGPCPPYGTAPHRYYFSLYALDTHFHSAPDATVATIKTVMKGHILARATFMGRYGRGGTDKQ